MEDIVGNKIPWEILDNGMYVLFIRTKIQSNFQQRIYALAYTIGNFGIEKPYLHF